MKTKQVLFIGLGAAIIWYLLSQSKRIDIGTAALSYLKLTSSGIRMRFKIPVLNRSDIGTQIDGFLGSLRYKNAVLGNIKLNQPAPIPARSSAEPEFEINITYGSIATELWDILQAKFLNVPTNGGGTPGTNVPVNLADFRVVGTLYVGQLGIDINQPIA